MKNIKERSYFCSNMTLKGFLKNEDRDIAVLIFNEKGMIDCFEYSNNQYKNIPKDLLKKEVMEANEDDNVLEVWIR